MEHARKVQVLDWASRLVKQIMVMGLAEPGTKNDCAGESQQQITKPDKSNPGSSLQASQGSQSSNRL
jgi:hypothetical protein